MDQHQRIGPQHVPRRQHFHIGLALHDFIAGLADILAADIEKAALTHGRLIDRRHRQLGRIRSHRRGRQQRECRRERAADDTPNGFHGFLPAAARGGFRLCVSRERRTRIPPLSMDETAA
jgi:hypothetical protein